MPVLLDGDGAVLHVGHDRDGVEAPFEVGPHERELLAQSHPVVGGGVVGQGAEGERSRAVSATIVMVVSPLCLNDGGKILLERCARISLLSELEIVVQSGATHVNYTKLMMNRPDSGTMARMRSPGEK